LRFRYEASEIVLTFSQWSEIVITLKCLQDKNLKKIQFKTLCFRIRAIRERAESFNYLSNKQDTQIGTNIDIFNLM
jgi:hypothetical protein